ncbi:protein FAM161B-like [Asterias rubens]|uniref:protein FAM161B-like n=1 Tax=Asterias rubens TaxID=7604 RepID=UPI00145591C7|nr:protein FAM161B-like [Asterias rubens]
MATGVAGHALSSVTNSCVKLPRNPKSRLAATFTERGGSFKPTGSKQVNGRSSKPRNTAPDYGAYDDSGNEYEGEGTGFVDSRVVDMVDRVGAVEHQSGSQFSAPTDEMFENIRNNIDTLTDEEFYRNLVDMKNEHRKTLSRLEDLYDQQLSLNENENEYLLRTAMTQEEPPFTKSGPVYIGDHKLRHIDDEIEQFAKSHDWSTKKDNVKDMSAKPPIGRPKTAWAGKARRSLRRSVPSESWNDITWTSESGHDTSGSELEMTTSTRRSRLSDSSYSANQDMVGKMWDDFSVDEYAPRSRSRSNSRASSVKSTGSIKNKEWSPKITIPKPFKMTQRDASKERTKSKACLELEHDLAEKEKAVEAECQKQFKATPAPAHTFMPLFDEIREREIERSRMNQENSKTVLQSQQKPFKFMKREEEKKKHHRSKSLPLAAAAKVKKPKFKARDVPKSVFDPTVNDRMLEEEEYRKIRIKMRSEEMLRQSALPPNMQLRGKEYTDGKMRLKLYKNREKKAFMTTEHKFRPQVNGDVPDYDQLYRQFQSDVQMKKREKEPTVVQPFNLRTSRIPAKIDKIREELKREEDDRKEKLRGSTSRSLSLRSSLNISEDAIPAKTTTASKLRMSVTEKSLKAKAEKEREAIEKERQKRIKERKLKQFVSKKALANDYSESLSASSKTKLHNYIQAGRSRQEEYDQELKEMIARVDSRPLLFERQSQVGAKKTAERKYQQALKDAGLDEEFLVRKGRGSTQASTSLYNDPEDSDDDDSYQYGKQGDSRDFSVGSGVRSTRGDPSYNDDFEDSRDDDNRSVSSIHTEEADETYVVE